MEFCCLLSFHSCSLQILSLNLLYTQSRGGSAQYLSKYDSFPYYALVEKYLSFANEFNVKLKKSLFIEPTESEVDFDQQTECVPMHSDTDVLSEELHDASPSSPISTSISLDSYLPIIEEDKETEYSYNNNHDDDETRSLFVFTEPIYCKTLLHLSNTFGNDYNEVMALLVQIGGFHHHDIDCILFEGDDYGLIGVKQSMDYIRCALENIERFTIRKNIKIQININVIDERNEVMRMSTKQSDTLYITNFDILNANIDCDLMKVFAEYGPINRIEIVTDDSQECMRVYALLQFKSIKDAVRCYTVHNASSNPLYFASRLLHIDYAN
eukprot:178998_1